MSDGDTADSRGLSSVSIEGLVLRAGADIVVGVVEPEPSLRSCSCETPVYVVQNIEVRVSLSCSGALAELESFQTAPRKVPRWPVTIPLEME